jgi:hypothetical protein
MVSTYHLGALRKLLCEQAELVAASCPAPPDQADLSRRIVGKQRTGNEICAEQQPRIDRKGRQQRGAKTIIDHLHQSRKACRFKTFGQASVSQTTS